MVARIFVLLLLWLLPAYPAVVAQNVTPEAITIEHGLSQGMIFDICQTRDGFLWVATKDGLNRYDGYNFKTFTNDPFDPFSLAENTVTALFEDSRGLLWVGTESKGLDLYNPRSGRFYHLAINFKGDKKLPDSDVYSIGEASDGAIYLLQQSNGLLRIVIPDVWKTQLPAEPDLSQARITRFGNERFMNSGAADEQPCGNPEPQKNGNLLVFSNKNPYWVNVADGTVQIATDRQWQELEARKKRDIWADFPFGLICFRNGNGRVVKYPPGMKINWAMVKPADDGHFWVSVNHQLWLLSPGEDLDFSKPDWLVDENISTVATDRNGNIWVGTQGYGLRKINPGKKLFHTGAAGASIWGLWRDTRGGYFCKIVNEVFPYHPATGKLGPERVFPNGPKRLLDFCIEPSGHIWMLGRGDEDNGRAELRHYSPDYAFLQSYPFDFYSYVYARLLRSRQGNIWISGLNCQMICFNPQTTRFEYFDYAALFGENANTVRVFALAEDGNGVLWIGTQQGLVKGIPNGRTFDFQLIQADAQKKQGLSNNSISCLLSDPADPGGVLWVGTKGGGINRLDLHRNHFQHITIKDGLPDNVIYGILPGDKKTCGAAPTADCSK
ncbi:MAG: hypothetical protein IPJ82_09545 [Lewinellaceae bacterium]|nr:hypothetical protein [Lewinellaceae bacterium]